MTPDRKSVVFLSNFDGSWESYLNDFIDLAFFGLNAVWSNTDNPIGFPPTRFLVFGGSKDEQRFKSYARYSQYRSRVWYSAYPDLTVPNIRTNMEIRRKLFSRLDDEGTDAPSVAVPLHDGQVGMVAAIGGRITVLDGAHNPMKLAALVATLQEVYPGARFPWVLAL